LPVHSSIPNKQINLGTSTSPSAIPQTDIGKLAFDVERIEFSSTVRGDRDNTIPEPSQEMINSGLVNS